MFSGNYSIQDFELESGVVLNEVNIHFQTFGEFELGKPVVWVCHALTGDTNVFNWWNGLFGENELFNPKDYFIVCANAIGSHYGSTSPINIQEEKFKYTNFPLLTTRDLAKSYECLRRFLQIDEVEILIGASLGGQQALEWSLIQPDVFNKLILVATNAKHSSYGIAFNESQRLAIENDPTFWFKEKNGGARGMAVARSIALLSYRNYEGYQLKQVEVDNEVVDCFKASSYQRYQGEKLTRRFNAYSYYALSKTMDAHNIGRGRGAIESVLKNVTCRTLVIGVDSDLLFPVAEQLLLKNHIPKADFVVIESKFGHDGFLIETDQLTDVIDDFLTNELKHYKPTVLKSIY